MSQSHPVFSCFCVLTLRGEATPKRHTQDTSRRCAALEAKGLLYVGSGVSGGEEGARYGPSLMPGGNPAAWPHIKDIFQVSVAI